MSINKLAQMKAMSQPRKWFTVNAAAETPEVLIYDVIGTDFWGDGIDPKAFRAEIANLAKDHKSINLRINSPGGGIHDGFSIYNALKQSGLDITVYVDGLAASAAAFIAMAGSRIYMPLASEMMIHDAWGFSMGRAAELRADADHLESLTGQIANIFQQKTGRKVEEIQEMMSAETWIPADQAVELGFADELIEDSKAAACAFDLAVFENAPIHFTQYQNALKKRAQERALRDAGSSRAEATRRASTSESTNNEVQNLIIQELRKCQSN
jgi:ATP-dependent Clp endopeptidase proteolytic subunit ClpP